MEKLLVVIDYQNDFISPDGALYVNGSEKLENRIVREINAFKKNKNDIVFLKDTHDQNYLSTEEGKHLPFPHTLKGTNGHELYGKVLLKSKGYPIFEKDAFGSRELAHLLEKKQYKEITLVGVMTNYCVLFNCVIAKTFNPNARCRVIKKAVGSGNKKTDKAVFKLLEELHFELI